MSAAVQFNAMELVAAVVLCRIVCHSVQVPTGSVQARGCWFALLKVIHLAVSELLVWLGIAVTD